MNEDILRLGRSIRRKVVLQIRNCIKQVNPSFPDFKELSYQLEDGIYDYAIKIFYGEDRIPDWSDKNFKCSYIDRARSIICNLSPKFIGVQNTELIYKLLNSEIDPYILGSSFTTEQMFPERYSQDTTDDSQIFKINNNTSKGILKCGKCKGYNTTYYQMQTRSAKLIGQKSIMPKTSWLCFWKNICNPRNVLINTFIFKC